MRKLKFRQMPGRFAICRLAPVSAIPEWGIGGAFVSLTRTADELSIVCPEDRVPQNLKAERGWTCFKLEGPFAFSQTGVLASFINPLAERGISIFAVSTFDTDYVLVKEEFASRALNALREAGHSVP